MDQDTRSWIQTNTCTPNHNNAKKMKQALWHYNTCSTLHICMDVLCKYIMDGVCVSMLQQTFCYLSLLPPCWQMFTVLEPHNCHYVRFYHIVDSCLPYCDPFQEWGLVCPLLKKMNLWLKVIGVKYPYRTSKLAYIFFQAILLKL